MADLRPILFFALSESPDDLKRRLVEVLQDESRHLSPEIRRGLVKMLQDGLGGFRLEIKGTKRARPIRDTLRNVAVFEAIDEARDRERVGESMKGHLSEAQWDDIVSGVISRHNAACKPDERWQPLNNQKAREQACRRGRDAWEMYVELQYQNDREADDERNAKAEK